MRNYTRALHIYLSFICVLAILLPASAQCEETPRPNIVFIFADDWGWGDLSCHGHPYVKTPNIDRLAREGTDFHRFTVASGVCSPSRTAVMTGHFPARYNIDAHFAWVPQNAKRNMPDWLDPKAPLLPKLLQNAGYLTAHFGKWHLANDMIPDSPLPSEYGYDRYGAFNCAGEQMPVHEDVRQTIEFIKDATTHGRPFFVNLWMHEPHTPFHTVPKYEWRHRHLPRADQIYASVLSHADDRIGELLQFLDEYQLTDETLVIFSSDNGPARSSRPEELALMYDTATGAGWGIAASRGITAGRKGYKASLFEGGINVPFIARWPGKIPAGKVDAESIISAVDLLPTFCELGGVTLPGNYVPDGTSQVKTLFGTKAPQRVRPLFWRFDARWPPSKDTPNHWAGLAIVHDHWKLLSNSEGTHVELYDLAMDPLETSDVSVSNENTVESLQLLLNQWRQSLPREPRGAVFSEERSSVRKNE